MSAPGDRLRRPVSGTLGDPTGHEAPDPAGSGDVRCRGADAMTAYGALRPVPRATDFLIDQVKRLRLGGKARAVADLDVFETSRVPEFGRIQN